MPAYFVTDPRLQLSHKRFVNVIIFFNPIKRMNRKRIEKISTYHEKIIHHVVYK